MTTTHAKIVSVINAHAQLGFNTPNPYLTTLKALSEIMPHIKLGSNTLPSGIKNTLMNTAITIMSLAQHNHNRPHLSDTPHPNITSLIDQGCGHAEILGAIFTELGTNTYWEAMLYHSQTASNEPDPTEAAEMIATWLTHITETEENSN